MLVGCYDRNDFPCKLIALIPKENNEFKAYQLIVQEGNGIRNKGSLLIEVYNLFSKLIFTDAEVVNS